MTVVKICGVTRVEDARIVAEAGADWIGLNFWPQSKRHVDAPVAADIARVARQVNPNIVVVGLFVNHTAVGAVKLTRLVGCDYAQLHGDESPEECAAIASFVPVIKAVAMRSADDVARLARYPCDTFVVDTPSAGYGGSGQSFDWRLARGAVATGKRIVLAGGLSPDNVADAIADVAPYGVDVASGVESAPGIKDAALVAAFIAAAKGEQT